MPRWKTTEQIINLSKDGEFFDENWMNYDRIWQYAPQPIIWNGNRPIKFEDVDIWEVIVEMSGPIGVYAAYIPYEEYYVVTNKWRVIKEFEGWMANERLEKFLIDNNIQYPKTNVSPTLPQQNEVEKKLYVVNSFKT